MGATAPASLTFVVPIQPSSATTTSTTRKPSYISAYTKSFQVTVTNVTSASGANVTPGSGLGPFTTNVTNASGTSPGSPCVVNGANYLCTVSMTLFIGTDTIKVQSFDGANGTGNVLSSATPAIPIVQGSPNVTTVNLDANVNALSVTAPSGYCASSSAIAEAQTVPTVGTSAVTFNVGSTDKAGGTISGPGLPLLTVSGFTDANGGHVVTGTGGNVTVTVNQATQSFTLSASTSNTSAPISVTLSRPAADGNPAFSVVRNFTFQSGVAPPSSFLAVAEQTGTSTRQIGLFTVTLGGSDAINAYTTPTLANNNNDVDYTNDMAFDGNGDLLLANGGTGNPDFGNFACVPAGTLATGSNGATVLASNGNTSTFDDPSALALTTDGSVAITNASFGSSTPDVALFSLQGAYAPASARNVAHSTYGSAVAQSIVALPTSAPVAAGSYVVSITNTTQANTHVLIESPTGPVGSLPSNNALLTDPYVGYDPINKQIITADNNGTSSNLSQWSLSTTTLSGSKHVLYDDGSGNSQAVPDMVAVSPTGYIAVRTTIYIGSVVFLFDNTAAHNPLIDPVTGTAFGPIAFDAVASDGSTPLYGGGTQTNGNNLAATMRWLTGTKLLVGLYSQQSGTVTSANGLYIFDITTGDENANGSATPGYDALGNPYAKGPKHTTFRSLSYGPQSAAYRP